MVMCFEGAGDLAAGAGEVDGLDVFDFRHCAGSMGEDELNWPFSWYKKQRSKNDDHLAQP